MSSCDHCEYSYSGRRRRVVNYNVKHLTNVVFEKAAEQLAQRVSQRSKASKKRSAASGSASSSHLKRKYAGASVNFDEVCSYDRVTANAERGVAIKRLDVDENLPTASGGFRMLMRLCSHSILELIRTKIGEENARSAELNNGSEQTAQILRYAWTRLSVRERTRWELMARIEAKKLANLVADVKNIATKKWERKSSEAKEVEDAVLAISSEASIDEDGGSTSAATSGNMEVQFQLEGKSDEIVAEEMVRDLPSMPPCEFRFCSANAIDAHELNNKLNLGIFRCPICPEKKSIVGAPAFQIHLIEDHHTLQLYGCHLCFEAFHSLDGLRRHPCQEFAAYTIGLLTADKKFELKQAMHTLVCAECNLQIPLPSGRQDANARKLVNCMKAHSCKRVVSCLVFFAEVPIGVEHVTVRGLEIKHSIPTSCAVCHERFMTVFDIEKHGADHAQPKLKCPLCPRFFFTQLFYRDHLASHLGEQWSMAPIVESSTLVPPAWMSHGSTKMGSLLTRVRGPYFALPSSISLSEEVSDNEDIVVARDVLKKKRVEEEIAEEKAKKGSEKENGRKRKAQKRSLDERCIYCKQRVQLLPEGARSDLCSCARENWLGHSPLQDQLRMAKGEDEVRLLMHSLSQKFSRTGYLYVGSSVAVHDTIKGGILMDTVYFCVKCNALLLGKQNTLRHLRICLQKDVETPDPEKSFDLNDKDIVFRLTHPLSAPNTRVWCPKCAATCCSIMSLRRHLAVDHGVFAPFNPPEGCKEIGIIEWTGVVRKLPTLAETTNIKLGLTKDGDFKLGPVNNRSLLSQTATRSGFTSEESSTSTQQPGPSAVWAVPSPRVVASSSPVVVNERTILHDSNNVVNPQTQLITAKRKECLVCKVELDSFQETARHLVNNHFHFCEMCGVAFSEKAPLEAHKMVCNSWPHQCADGEYLPFCGICNFTLSNPKRYFYHIANFHFDRFYFDQATRMLMPTLMWKKLSFSEASRKKGVASATVIVPTSSASQTRPRELAQLAVDSSNVASIVPVNEAELPRCFLCEKVFGTNKTLREHLAEHEEQWTDCPVCHNNNFMNFPVASHEELLKHVVAKHMHRSDSAQEVTMICSLCCTCVKCDSLDAISVRRTEEQMFRHIVYSCNGVSTCFVCNNGRTIRPDDLKKHRIKTHINIYERFGCSSCPKKFLVQSDFKNHVCNTHVRCSCGERKEFTERDYETHFRTHLNQMGDFCLLCNKFLATKQQQSSHMNFHKSISVGTRRMLDLHAKRRSSMKQNQSTSEKASTPPFEAQETQSKGTGVQLVAQVKQEKEQDDDVIILDEDISSSVVLPASVPASLSAAAKQVSETVSAAESIAAQQAVNSEGQQAQSVPVPINFMANVRLEQDAGHVDQSRPLYEQSHEEAPVIDIPIETQEEAINSVLEKLITAVVDATEQTDERSATGVTNTPVLSPSQVDDDADEAVKENKDGASQGSEYIGDEAKLNGSGEHDDILIIDEPSGDDSDQVSPVATTETGATVNLAVAETQEVDVSRTEIGNGEQSSEVPTEDDDDEIQILDVVVRSEENGGQDREQCVSKPQVEDEAQKEEVMGVVVQKAAEESVRIRDVVDDGDEDLQVIGVGEGPGLQFVKRREARVQCPNCTARFMTHAALEVHSSSHRYDAGNTISSVYGVPQDQIVFICRLCCLAYESKAIYEKHMRTHGLLQNCQHCAVVAFNEEQMKQHVPQHAAEGQRLTYVCAFCATTYTSDERVYHHMMRTHGMVVMYFCKNCGSGSTNGQLVYAHISRNECGSQHTAVGQSSKLGIAPASMFHYQPANETRYVEAVNAGALVVVVPSECVHRSFLMPQNEHVMMTCPQCHGLMSFNRLQSENPAFITNLPRVLSRGPDDSGAILTQLVQLWRSGASRKSQDNGENRQSTAPIWQPVLAATDTSTTSSVRLSNANTRALRRRRLPDCDAQAQQQQMVASRVATVPPQHGQQRPLLPRAAQQRPSVPPTDTGSQALMQSAFSTAQNLPPSVNATAIAAAGLSATARAQQHFLTTVAGAQQTVAAHTSSSYGNVQQRAMAASSGNMQISRRQACAVSTGGARYDNVAQVLSTYGHGMQQAIQQHAAMSVQIPVQSNASNAAIRVQSVPLQNVQYTQRQASAVSVPQFAPSPMLRASAPTTSSSYVLAHQQNGVIPAQHPLLRAQLAATPSTSGAANSAQRQFIPSTSLSAVQSRMPNQVDSATPISEDFIVRNSRGELVCTRPECAGIRIEKVASGHVHNLRHNIHDTYFCLECGKAFSQEQFAIRHQVEVHHNNQVPLLTLRCPLCPEKPIFHSLRGLRNHLSNRMEHVGRNLQFPIRWVECRCNLLFATDEARQLHEAEHRLSKSSGCCLLCGTSRGFWSLPTFAQCPPLEHTYIHAFSIWGMCRECGLCFPNELKKEQFVRHYQQVHWAYQTSTCHVCDAAVHPYNVQDHALNRHFVIGIKTDRSRPFAVNVSEPLISSYLGFAVPGNAKI